MADRLAVVDPKYCSEVDAVLTIKEVSSWSGNDFRVTDAETGNLLFTCEGKALSSREEKVLADAAGAEVARMRHPIMETWMSRMKVEGPGYSFNVTEKFKFSNEAKAEVTDLISREERTLYIYGNWSARTMQVYDGKKKGKGRMLAYCEQKLTWSWHDPYELTVLQGTDMALCVLLCLAFENFFGRVYGGGAPHGGH